MVRKKQNTFGANIEGEVGEEEVEEVEEDSEEEGEQGKEPKELTQGQGEE